MTPACPKMANVYRTGQSTSRFAKLPTLDVYADLLPEDLTSVSIALDRAARDSFVGQKLPTASGALRFGGRIRSILRADPESATTRDPRDSAGKTKPPRCRSYAGVPQDTARGAVGTELSPHRPSMKHATPSRPSRSRPSAAGGGVARRRRAYAGALPLFRDFPAPRAHPEANPAATLERLRAIKGAGRPPTSPRQLHHRGRVRRCRFRAARSCPTREFGVGLDSGRAQLTGKVRVVVEVHHLGEAAVRHAVHRVFSDLERGAGRGDAVPFLDGGA